MIYNFVAFHFIQLFSELSDFKIFPYTPTAFLKDIMFTSALKKKEFFFLCSLSNRIFLL